jgi:hypothetical protein
MFHVVVHMERAYNLWSRNVKRRFRPGVRDEKLFGALQEVVSPPRF